MPSSTARAVVSRLDTGNHPRDTLFRHCLCSLQSTKYGYIRYGQSSKGCALPALLMQSSVYRVRLYQIRAIIQGMRHCLCNFQSTEYGYIRYGQSSKGYALPAPLVQSSVYRVRLQSSEESPFRSGQSIRYGQSSKRCALPAPFVQSSVYRVRLQQSSEGCLPLLLVQLSVY